MPKKKTAHRRELAREQARRREAERRAAVEEQQREEHARLVAERARDPRFVQQQAVEGGGKVLSWQAGTPFDRELRNTLEEQKRLFRAKFGREPGPEDPVFFDPDADEPVPMPMQGLDDSLDALARDAEIGKLDVDPAFIRAWQELGFIVTEENRHLFSAAEVAAWTAAVHRHHGKTDA